MNKLSNDEAEIVIELKWVDRVLFFALTVPVTVAVYIIIDAGLFDLISLYLSSVAKYLPVPAEAISIIAATFENSSVPPISSILTPPAP